MRRPPLVDFDTVCQVLGGDQAVADLLGVGITAVSNWRMRSGRLFPARYYLLISNACAPWYCVQTELFSFDRPPGLERQELSYGSAKPVRRRQG